MTAGRNIDSQGMVPPCPRRCSTHAEADDGGRSRRRPPFLAALPLKEISLEALPGRAWASSLPRRRLLNSYPIVNKPSSGKVPVRRGNPCCWSRSEPGQDSNARIASESHDVKGAPGSLNPRAAAGGRPPGAESGAGRRRSRTNAAGSTRRRRRVLSKTRPRHRRRTSSQRPRVRSRPGHQGFRSVRLPLSSSP